MIKLLRILLILGIYVLLACAAQGQSYTDGLIAYYPFDGDTSDATGNGNDGSPVGTISFAIDRFGNSNACLAMSGGTGVANGVDIPSLATMQYAPASYSAWVLISNYPAMSQGNICMTLVGREECGQGNDGAVCIYSDPSISAGNVFAYFYGSYGGYAPVAPPTNKWCQLVSTLDTDGTLAFYLNGNPLSVTGYGQPNGVYEDFRIGSSSGDGCPYEKMWNGLIDDVRIYNRVLSSDDVSALYQFEEPPCDNNVSAVAIVTNGFVVGVTILDGGCSFTNPPPVTFVGGGGFGAAGVVLVSNGAVVGVQITSAGLGYTNTPLVEIGGPPQFLTEPVGFLANYGDSNLLSTTATGGSLSYTWFQNGIALTTATTNSLVFTNITGTNSGTYYVEVSNIYGTIISTNVEILVNPYISQSFGGLETEWGFTNMLTVVAGGTGPISYQWYDDGSAIFGATNATLTFSGIQLTNAGNYYVEVTTPLGTIDSPTEQVVVNPGGVTIGYAPVVTLNGVVGYTYAIQKATNLISTNWITLTNLTLTQPVESWPDTNQNPYAEGIGQHFYRVVKGTP